MHLCYLNLIQFLFIVHVLATFSSSYLISSSENNQGHALYTIPLMVFIQHFFLLICICGIAIQTVVMVASYLV